MRMIQNLLQTDKVLREKIGVRIFSKFLTRLAKK